MQAGSKVYVGQERQGLSSVSTYVYNIDEFRHFHTNGYQPFDNELQNCTTWIDIDGVHNVTLVDEVCLKYGIHLLTVEDILNTYQRPKIEIFENYIYCAIKMLSRDPATGLIEDEQVSIILTKNTVISFQEQTMDVFDPIRQRMEMKESRLRRKRADYLLFCLLDVIVDNYIDIIELKGEEISKMDQHLSLHPEEEQLSMILEDKAELLNLRKYIYPLREEVAKIKRADCPLIDKSNIAYYGDLQDHIVQVIENIDLQREINNDQRESYHSNMTLRMNKVMEILTIITAIFIPLTFIVGIYGMNFENMPELKMKYGYYYTLIAMLIVAIVMILWFKRKKWI